MTDPDRTARDELVDRCRHERHQLIAATAGLSATLLHRRGLGRWLRVTSRLVRMLAAGSRAMNGR